MRTLIFLTADYANITQDKKLNVMGIFNQIWSKSFPAKHSTFHLIIKLCLELGEEPNREREIEIKLINEDATWERPLGPPRNFKFPEERIPGFTPEFNLILGVRDMVFPEPGIYQFVVLVDGEQKGMCTLGLVKI